jgi:hypothetical protein
MAIPLLRACLVAAALAAVAMPALAHVCPKKPCPQTDTLDFFPIATLVTTTTSAAMDTAAKCAESCPCNALYFTWSQALNPVVHTCNCYRECTGQFMNATVGGTRGTITHGYLNCTGSCHDPHFVGAHGTRFDFNGELDKSFCLVSDKGLHINSLFKGYETANTQGASVTADGHGLRSWMGELGFVWADSAAKKHSLRLVARDGKESARGSGFVKAVELDGATVSLPAAPGDVVKAADLTLTFLGTFQNEWAGEEDKYSLTIGEKLHMNLHVGPAVPAWQLPGNALVHFSFQIRELAPSPAVHGVLGQTYRNTASQLLKAIKYSALGHMLRSPVQADGPSGLGFLDGKMADYVSSNVLATDCSMSAF